MGHLPPDAPPCWAHDYNCSNTLNEVAEAPLDALLPQADLLNCPSTQDGALTSGCALLPGHSQA
eukprot:scaffold127291_cov20-Tisochrysis_lutea.AAC.2